MSNNQQDLQMQEIAQKILDKTVQNYNSRCGTNKDKYGFVITILMIISITLTLIRVIQECNKNKLQNFDKLEKYRHFTNEIKNISLKKTWFTKMITKKTIRKNLTKEVYKEYGIDIMNAILDIGENLTPDEIITLVEVANV